MAMSTYLIVVSSVMVQMMSDSAPTMNASLICVMPPLPSKIDFITYSGEVPISPYTMPMATRHIVSETLCFFSICSCPSGAADRSGFLARRFFMYS